MSLAPEFEATKLFAQHTFIKLIKSEMFVT